MDEQRNTVKINVSVKLLNQHSNTDALTQQALRSHEDFDYKDTITESDEMPKSSK